MSVVLLDVLPGEDGEYPLAVESLYMEVREGQEDRGQREQDSK